MTSRVLTPSPRPNLDAARLAPFEPGSRRARSSRPAATSAGRRSPARRGSGPRPAAAFAALVALAALPAAAQTLGGPPIDLSVSEPCSQDRPAVARLASGDTVTAWVGPFGDFGEDFGVGARIAGWPGGAGQPLGDELRLDGGAEEHFPRGVAVAAAPDRFYAAWWGVILEPAGQFILLRGFDTSGQPLGDPVEAADVAGTIVTGAALAADPQGRPVLAWRDDTGGVYLRLYEHDLSPRGEPIVIAPPAPLEPQRGDTPALAVAADGGMLVAWAAAAAGDPAPSPPVRVLARRAAADGTPVGAAFQVNDLAIAGFLVEPAVAALEGGGFAVLWSSHLGVGVEQGIYGRRLAANGAPTGAGFAVSTLDLEYAADPDLAALDGGGLLAVWSGARPGENGTEAFARLFGAGGHPAGPEQMLPEAPDPVFLQSRPVVAAVAAGRAFVAWRQSFPFPPILPPPCVEQASIVGQPLTIGCAPSESRLCLQGGRFAVDVTADAVRPGAPFPLPAGAEPLTDDTGTFWFFRPANVELMVKLLDGRGVNGRWWFFSGALSNVGYEIVVTDTLSGVERRYQNLSGELASRADTTAFEDPLPPPAAPVLAGLPAGGAAIAPPEAAAPRPLAAAGELPAPCAEPEELCLHGDRIRVRIDWTDPRSGDSGTAVAVPLSGESGWFWFFGADNAEAVVKVLYGWPVNDYYWVFFGGLTDLELTISVADVIAGTGKTYHNPPLTLNSFADTAALPGPFPCPVCSAAAPASSTRSADGDGKP